MDDINFESDRAVSILYTNWKDRTALRKIVPIEIVWESSEWHPEHQWVLKAWDFEKDAHRSFAIRDIRSWFTND